jgi:hypothetical protein
MSILRVDKILPFQSSSVEIFGDVTFIGPYNTGSFTGSFVGDGSGLTGLPSATSIDTGSFATTGSNTFVGTEIINGDLKITGSLNLRSPSFPTSGSLVTIDDSRASIFVTPSGSNTSGNIQLYDAGDTRSILIINASQTSIGSEATSNAYGNNGCQNYIRGNTRFFQNITSSANIQAVSFIGDGSGLTGVPSSLNTGSFATTSSNSFVGNQTVNGDLNVVGNLTATQYIVSSSVSHITTSFSSGSTQFGDSAGDTHQFTGSLNVRGNQTISGSLNMSGSINLNGRMSQTGLGTRTTIIGSGSGLLTSGPDNSFFGAVAGEKNTTGGGNSFFGFFAGKENSVGIANSHFGGGAGQNNISGSYNASFGYWAGYNLVSGDFNTLVGPFAGINLYEASYNIALGLNSGRHAANGSTPLEFATSSIFIGNDARANANNQTNQIVIGDAAIGNGSNTVVIGNTSITSTTLRGRVSASLFSGSFVGDGSGLTGIPGVTPINTGSFAVTGSNTFVGNQIVTGSVTISGSISQVGVGNRNIIIREVPQTNLTTGEYNTIIGAESGITLTEGASNTFIGQAAGGLNVIGNDNVFIGRFTGYRNKTSQNTFVGSTSGFSNTQGNNNSFFGYYAAYNNSVGSDNTILGHSAGFTNTSGSDNTFVGERAGYLNTTAGNGTFVGKWAGYNNSVAPANTFVGSNAGFSNTSGSTNTFLGFNSGYSTTTATENTFVGAWAGYSNVTGQTNTALGNEAGQNNQSGSNNVFLGYRAGRFLANGSTALTNIDNSVFIGHSSRANADSETNQIVIGHQAVGNGSNTVTIGNNSITDTYLKGDIMTSGSIIPAVGVGETTSSFSLGSPTAAWKDIWVSDGTINFVNGAGVQQGSLSTTSNGLQLNSTTINGSLTVPGSGSFRDFINDRTKFRSIRGNGAGLFNIVEQGDTTVVFTSTKITTNDLSGSITSNLSGATTGTYNDLEPTTNGNGRGARLRFTIAGGVVTSVAILNVSNSNLSFEEDGQPANRQGVGYVAGDTLTVAAGTGGIGGSGNLVITLRPEDIETYFGVDSNFKFNYHEFPELQISNNTFGTNIGIGGGIADGIGSIAAGSGTVAAGSTGAAIAVGFRNRASATATSVFGAYNTGSNAQTVVGIASIELPDLESAFIIGNGTGINDRSNLLVAQGSKVQVTGSLDVSGNGYVILSQVSASYNFADDTAAAGGGVPLGGLYHTTGTIKIRLV